MPGNGLRLKLMAAWQSCLQALHAIRRTDPSKQTIMWALLLLIGLFIAGMWIMSSLNLSYSQRAMSKLRQSQIEDTFRASFNTIDSRQLLFEQYAEDLARLGELFRNLRSQGGTAQTAELRASLRDKLTGFPDAHGSGIWFAPGRFPGHDGPLGLLAYRNAENRIAFPTGHADAVLDYRDQPWFAANLPQPGVAQQQANPGFHWSAAYYNPLSSAAVVTLVRPMRDETGSVIGYVSVDWNAEDIIDLVSKVDVTPNTFAFLTDRNNRKISSLNRMTDIEQAQSLMDAILETDLAQKSKPESTAISPSMSESAKVRMQRYDLLADGNDYAIYYAGTRANMLFGVGVPRAEIDAVLAPIRGSNYQILIFTGLVMLILSGIILYRVAGLMRELQASYTDPLTQLPNRSKLLLDLEKEGTSRRALIVVNLDRFKEINGLFGHRCGDHVLKTLAERIREFANRSPQYATARQYRLSGDEFALCLHQAGGENGSGLTELVRGLSEFLQQQRIGWEQYEIRISATLGAAASRDKNDAPTAHTDSLLTRAGIALKQARLEERNFKIHDPSQSSMEAFEHNLLWAGRVMDALQEGRIVPYFQPIYCNSTRRIVKYECLVRMIDKEGGVVAPGLFLDVARKLRLNHAITRIMVEKCFATFAAQSYEFSINLSYADLLDPDLTAFIKQKLDETGIGPRVIFEILESDGIENYQDVRAFIDAVKARGCRIAIDDFGTGYSNFEHLLRLDVDIIKIDGSLIRQLHEEPHAFSVTQGIVHFARSLNIATVAEFVHCEAVQERVAHLGIDFSQGTHIGMPQDCLADVLEDSEGTSRIVTVT